MVGHNVVVASVGSKGSGKTFTLFGSKDNVNELSTTDGLFIRCCNGVFEYIKNADESSIFNLKLNAQQVTNSDIKNLLHHCMLYKNLIND